MIALYIEHQLHWSVEYEITIKESAAMLALIDNLCLVSDSSNFSSHLSTYNGEKIQKLSICTSRKNVPQSDGIQEAKSLKYG